MNFGQFLPPKINSYMFTPLKSFVDSLTDHDSPFSINSHTLFQLNIYEVFFLVSIMSLLNSLTHNKIMIRDGSGAYPKWTFKGI